MTTPLPEEQKRNLQRDLEGVAPALLEQHLSRLDLDYFQEFTPAVIRTHLQAAQALSAETLAQVRLESASTPGQYRVTVVAFDYMGLFSVITGLLTLSGFDIRSGNCFTYASTESAPRKPASGFFGLPGRRAASTYYFEKAKVIDAFDVVPIFEGKISANFEEIFNRDLNRFLSLLEANKFFQVRAELNKRMALYLARFSGAAPAERLLPIDINFDSDNTHTLLNVSGMDTPGFLYALSGALTTRGIKIHKVSISTDVDRVRDLIYITDRYDRTLSDKNALERLQAAIVLIKQFTLLLPKAPDPDLAFRQFFQFLDEVLSGETEMLDLFDLENPMILATLARLFGTGEYLWEEFVRMQYRSLLPLLKDIEKYNIRKSAPARDVELRRLLQGETSYSGRVEKLNQYKDKELFRLDLLYLIYQEKTFLEFSDELNCLAEVVLQSAVQTICEELLRRHGRPMVDGEPCAFAVFGLGKFGGRELGYASDIEMVLIYDAQGQTESWKNKIPNNEFFNHLVQELKSVIRAKEAGIFEIDLRLRPHGNKGELAASFEKWKAYYSQEGSAMDFERQALIKLRPVYGPPAFISRVMQARDAIAFTQPPVSIENVLALRLRQRMTLVAPGRVNAKFSEGGLVDLEYGIQFLQLLHGAGHPEVRDPNTVNAMQALFKLGALSATEFEKLFTSYAFLRRLINALRMVRGNAKDLVIPAEDADEFVFLARRLGYSAKGEYSPEIQLREDLARTFRTVDEFARVRFHEKKPHAFERTHLSELLMAPAPAENEIKQRMLPFRVEEPLKAFELLRRMMEKIQDKNAFITTLVLIERHVAASPDPDKVLMCLDRYLSAVPDRTAFLKQVVFYPRLLELLMLTFGYSDFLTNRLLQEPQWLVYLAKENTLFVNKSRDHLRRDVATLLQSEKDAHARLERLRQYQSREMLRIGLRDVSSFSEFHRVVREISNLAEVLLEAVYRECILQAGFDEKTFLQGQSVIAMGKLGGRELNYSSDIDLIFILADDLPAPLTKQSFEQVNNALIQALTAATASGKFFRVDFRLRPYGGSGTLTGTALYHKNYYESKADGWELQAWLKARPVAGNHELGQEVIRFVHNCMVGELNQRKIFASIDKVRGAMLEKLEKENLLEDEVKLGPGGIRAIEFLIQRYQIRYAEKFPDVLSGNTLVGLTRLLSHELFSEKDAAFLKEAYLFLRQVEHRIQLLGLQQLHVLPTEVSEQARLARRLSFQENIQEPAAVQFRKKYSSLTREVARLTEKLLNDCALPSDK